MIALSRQRARRVDGLALILSLHFASGPSPRSSSKRKIVPLMNVDKADHSKMQLTF